MGDHQRLDREIAAHYAEVPERERLGPLRLERVRTWELLGFEAIVEGDLRDGQHRNPTGRPEWFTTAYFHLPDELALEVAEAGLRLQALVAVEGPAWMLPDIERWLADPDRREVVLRAIRRLETEPSLLGASAHLLAVARR
jgi:hypothetical protein